MPTNIESFVSALEDLAFTLQKREELRLNQIIPNGCIEQLVEISKILDENNAHNMCAQLREILDTLGDVRNTQLRDDVENLQAIVYHLGIMYKNPLGSDDVFKNLDHVLMERISRVEQMIEALENCSCR